MKWFAGLYLTVFLLPFAVHAQSEGVPVYHEGRGAKPKAKILAQIKTAKDQGLLLTMEKAEEQMLRSHCELRLPPPNIVRLEGRELWKRARAAHIRVGWYYLCKKCEHWHLNLAGGYVLTADGVVATCAHVVQGEEMREGFLVAATDDDQLLPVTELLAVNGATDTAILKVQAKSLTALPLATDTFPGDAVWCFSDPEEKRGYYSEGIVSRFVKRPFLSKKELAALGAGAQGQQPPVWIETTTEWAPGSSGSAIVDAFGNTVGHVSEIQTMLEEPTMSRAKDAKTGETTEKQEPLGTTIIFHQGIAAQNIRALIQTP